MERTFWCLTMEVMVKILQRCSTTCDGRSRGFERQWKGTIGERRWRAFRRIQNETTVRENMRRTLWWLATASSERIYLAVREITLVNLPCKMGKKYENDAKCSPVARLRDGVDLGGYRQDRGWQVESASWTHSLCLTGESYLN
jgi:hypothetical protein